jgi:hypothetical protein
VREALESEDQTDTFLGQLSSRLDDVEARKIAVEHFSRVMTVDAVAAAELQLLSRARAIFGV